MPTLTPFTQDQFLAGIATLRERIGEDGWHPALLVGIGRGGLTPCVFLSHAIGVPMLSVDYSQRDPEFADALLAVLARRAADGRRLLFIDDINDSGRTIGEVRAALAAAGADPTRVRFAVLIDNVRSGQRVEYRGRTIDRAENKDWFVFPWEAVAPVEVVEDDAEAVPERLA